MIKTRGIIAAGHELTARAGETMLRDGGNAYDAALAALAAACVAEPVLASLGGGGFLLARPAGAAPRVYDFFAHTPRVRRAEAELEFFPIVADFGTATQEFHIGRGSVAAPGLVRGMFEIHRELGSIPMRDIVGPAVQYGSEGVTLNALQAYIYSIVAPIYMCSAETRAIYASKREDGRPLTEGECLRQPELADALDNLALEGDRLFYEGEIATSIINDMAHGGHLSAEDLSAYRVEQRVPLLIDYRGVRLATNPPPSSGGLLIAFGLKLLEDLQPEMATFGSNAHLERVARAIELTAEGRLAMQADQGRDPDPERLLDPRYVNRYRDALSARASSRRGTTHISIIDSKGNIASLTLSNGEGAGYLVPGTGIMLNNMLGEEDLNPGGFHRWTPDQRMSSMMAPTVVVDADGYTIATGSGGSNRLRTAILQVLLNLINYRLSVEEAVQAPRVHYEEGLLSVEGGHDVAQLGHLLEVFPQHQIWEGLNLFFGGAHTVVSNNGELHGAGDPRRGGVCTVIP
jgi:gamma-glutamyltranspeptidase/glutathione hydrolase